VIRRYDVITFDCYGTLIDWDRGITAAFESALVGTNAKLDARQVWRAYEEIEPVVEAEPFRPYREVLTESARRVADRLGWALRDGDAAFLARSLPNWPPFRDTNPALMRLHDAGYRLAILSNVDDELLAWTRRHFAVPFEFTITAQQVRSYKPGHRHFRAARELVAGRRWLHAAQSYFHDVTPAADLGIPVAWINRGHQKPTGTARPTRELHSMAELADWLAPDTDLLLP
jgi:2-haloalkanoic acid dehalogenase type II